MIKQRCINSQLVEDISSMNGKLLSYHVCSLLLSMPHLTSKLTIILQEIFSDSSSKLSSYDCRHLRSNQVQLTRETCK